MAAVWRAIPEEAARADWVTRIFMHFCRLLVVRFTRVKASLPEASRYMEFTMFWALLLRRSISSRIMTRHTLVLLQMVSRN